MILIVLLMSLTSSLAFADSALLKKGQPAPFDGKLYSADAVATIIANHEAELKALRMVLELEKKKLRAKLTADVQTAQRATQAATEQVRACQLSKKVERDIYTSAVSRMQKESSSSVWKSPYLHFFLGVATCSAAAAGIGAAIK